MQRMELLKGGAADYHFFLDMHTYCMYVLSRKKVVSGFSFKASKEEGRDDFREELALLSYQMRRTW